jgi:hypothetical protein
MEKRSLMAAQALRFETPPATMLTSAWGSPRGNVLVHPEHIVRVPPHLELGQTPVVVTIRGVNPLVAFFFREEIDIGPARRVGREYLGMASASMMSVLFDLTKGLTNCAGTIRTSCPKPPAGIPTSQ